jgi:hypothetical protein
MSKMKNLVRSFAVAAVFVTSLGVASFAQDWGRGRWEDRRDDQWGRNDRYDDRERGWDEKKVRKQLEKGYRDGLDRGRKDAQANKVRNPNNFNRYREGDRFYRRGFERGFFEAYDQFSNYNRGRGRGRWGW